MKNILIVYHNNCLDGLVAAFICGKELSFNNNTITFLPYNYQVKAPSFIGFTDVYIVDFSFSLTEMANILTIYPNVNFVLIDHHKTAQELAKLCASSSDSIARYLNNFIFLFDKDRCGAMLTWKYFNPNSPFDYAPLFIKYIEDRHLWKWALPESKAINAYIRSQYLDLFSMPDIINDFTNDAKLQDFVLRGLEILEKENVYIQEAIKNVNYVFLCCHNIPYVKTDKLASEVIEALYKQENTLFAMGWTEMENNKVNLQFRSNGFDVSLIAKSLGGGGHQCASGAHISRTQAKELGIKVL